MAMFNDQTTRVGLMVFSALVVSLSPISLPAAVHQVVQNSGASAKPSAAVPALPVNQPTGNAVAAEKPATEPPAQRLDVNLADGRITVDATNASLSVVLHEVADKAGIAITGGVSDERVFGRYGPASPSAILTVLLEGTGTNMLLVDGAKGASELVLTPRVGGPTPPPNAQAALQALNDDQDGRAGPRYTPPGRSYQPPGPGRGPSVPPPNFGPPAQSGFQSGANGTDDSRTPQQIYEQLQVNQQKPPDQ